MRLSPHFTLDEMLVTRHPGMQRQPNDAERGALVVLCERVLEPVRALLGVPLHVTSGFRSEAVNALIGGARLSQHTRGEAADVVPVTLDVEEAMAKIAAEIDAGRLVVDQAIVYPGGGFVHLSYTRRRLNRNQVLRSLAPRGSHGPYEAWYALDDPNHVDREQLAALGDKKP